MVRTPPHSLCTAGSAAVLKFLVLLWRSYVLGDDCLPRREHLWSGACGVQALTDRTWITLEGGKRQYQHRQVSPIGARFGLAASLMVRDDLAGNQFRWREDEHP